MCVLVELGYIFGEWYIKLCCCGGKIGVSFCFGVCDFGFDLYL